MCLPWGMVRVACKAWPAMAAAAALLGPWGWLQPDWSTRPLPACCSLSSLSWQKLKDKGWGQQQQPEGQQQQPQQPGGSRREGQWLAAPSQPSRAQQHTQSWRQRWQQRRRPHPPPPPLPAARWQSGAVPVAGLGMLVHGGDAPRSSGKGKQPPSSNSTGDAWLLRLPELRWQQGCACQLSADTGECVASPEAPTPSPRRAHSLVSYQVCGFGLVGLVVGGRRGAGTLGLSWHALLAMRPTRISCALRQASQVLAFSRLWFPSGMNSRCCHSHLRSCAQQCWHPFLLAQSAGHVLSAWCTRGFMLPMQDEDGTPAFLLFGGRREDGLLLNDVWKGTLSMTGEAPWQGCRGGRNHSWPPRCIPRGGAQARLAPACCHAVGRRLPVTRLSGCPLIPQATPPASLASTGRCCMIRKQAKAEVRLGPQAQQPAAGCQCCPSAVAPIVMCPGP